MYHFSVKSFYFVFSVAGSTSLSLLVTRVIVARVLIPKFNKVEASGGSSSSSDEAMDLAIKLLRAFDTFTSIFSTLWLLIGSYFVYSVYDDVTHKKMDDENYCDYTAYTFAFIVITIGFISLALSIIAALCMCVIKNTDAWINVPVMNVSSSHTNFENWVLMNRKWGHKMNTCVAESVKFFNEAYFTKTEKLHNLFAHYRKSCAR